jgi:hypothetical protein
MKYLILFFIVFTSSTLTIVSQEKYWSSNSSSHEILNDQILNLIQKYSSTNLKGGFEDTIVIHIKMIEKGEYKIYIRSSNFNSEKSQFQAKLTSYKPVGFFYQNETMILLYGDVDTFFKKLNPDLYAFDIKNESSEIISIHNIFKIYSYKQVEVYGDLAEHLELIGESDKIE